MAGWLDDPNDENATIVDHEMRLRRLERSPQIGYTSIDEGSLRVASEEGLIVEGSQKVTGVLKGDGELDWTGTARFRSPGTLEAGDSTFEDVKVTETLNVTAAASFDSSVQIKDTLDVTATTRLRAATTVEADLNVTEGGKIAAGVVVIDGTDGGRVAAPGATLSLVGAQVTFTGATTAKNGLLSEGDIVALLDVTVAGGLYLDSVPTITIPGAPAGLLAIDGGRVKRTI